MFACLCELCFILWLFCLLFVLLLWLNCCCWCCIDCAGCYDWLVCADCVVYGSFACSGFGCVYWFASFVCLIVLLYFRLLICGLLYSVCLFFWGWF